MSSAPLSVTMGARLDRPQGRIVTVDGVLGLAALLARRATEADAWWAPGVFAENYRNKSGWRAAAVVGVDLDYCDANGEHVALPDPVVSALADAVRQRRFPGSIAHRTPRGVRVVVVLAETVMDAVEWQTAAAGACVLVEEAMGEIGVLAREGKPGLVVDAAASRDRARLLYVANGRVKGEERRAKVAILRGNPYAVADLAARAPQVTPPPVVAPFTGPATGGADMERRVLAYLKACPPAVSGQRGHDATFGVVARVVRGFDLRDEDAVLGLLAEWNSRCLPPWSERELRHKIRDALALPDPRGDLLKAPPPHAVGNASARQKGGAAESGWRAGAANPRDLRGVRATPRGKVAT